MRKSERQMLIKQIVLNNEVSTQDELLTFLHDKGVTATQATISRDIKELNLVKTPSGDGGIKYTIYQNDQVTLEEKLDSTIKSVVTDVTQVQFINVVKTLPGNAHVIGALIDDIHYPEIVGTVAGNDTIMLISKTDEEAEGVFRHFDGVLRENE
ncbi:transcriptional regulator, ArgR family [Alkalibacterium subtropicum]|uniref:Arginine repressor n=1 Tax=Alkalibacterium subtropicum TaxID=753702 RepID=A0A1I1LP39_9LACT|nr:arginine repressor [Alkalibacterium subtropicum]SFC74821.1 transcriptional regulator, ArgR family [Alkalibacterium subtropicum]